MAGSETLESIFPRLKEEGYAVTSPSSRDYNCFAWAAGDDTQRWNPDPQHQHYWPVRTRNCRVETFVSAFATLGFVSSGQEAGTEPGFEKVAIYAEGFAVRHVARQLPSGQWTSKCGKLEDITHNTLSSLEGEDYGKVVLIMKRPIRSDSPPCNGQ